MDTVQYSTHNAQCTLLKPCSSTASLGSFLYLICYRLHDDSRLELFESFTFARFFFNSLLSSSLALFFHLLSCSFAQHNIELSVQLREAQATISTLRNQLKASHTLQEVAAALEEENAGLRALLSRSKHAKHAHLTKGLYHTTSSAASSSSASSSSSLSTGMVLDDGLSAAEVSKNVRRSLRSSTRGDMRLLDAMFQQQQQRQQELASSSSASSSSASGFAFSHSADIGNHNSNRGRDRDSGGGGEQRDALQDKEQQHPQQLQQQQQQQQQQSLSTAPSEEEPEETTFKRRRLPPQRLSLPFAFSDEDNHNSSPDKGGLTTTASAAAPDTNPSLNSTLVSSSDDVAPGDSGSGVGSDDPGVDRHSSMETALTAKFSSNASPKPVDGMFTSPGEDDNVESDTKFAAMVEMMEMEERQRLRADAKRAMRIEATIATARDLEEQTKVEVQVRHIVSCIRKEWLM